MHRITCAALLVGLPIAIGCSNGASVSDAGTTGDASGIADVNVTAVDAPVADVAAADAIRADTVNADTTVVDGSHGDSAAADGLSSDGNSTDALPGEFNADFCAMVAGTLNIHWQRVDDVEHCTGIENTDGNPTLAAANRAVTMSGVSVSNGACIGTAAYHLVLASDNLSLTGSDTANSVPMTLTRSPGQACFVGHWVDANSDFVAHISVTAFGIVP